MVILNGPVLSEVEGVKNLATNNINQLLIVMATELLGQFAYLNFPDLATEDTENAEK